jgi:sensor histidine kinase YesM
MSLNSLKIQFGDVEQEYNFYKTLLNYFADGLSEEDYEIWNKNKDEFIEQIVIEDEIYWQFEEIISMLAKGFIKALKD